MKNAVYDKTIKILRNKIDVKLVQIEKDYLHWTSKVSSKFLIHKSSVFNA